MKFSDNYLIKMPKMSTLAANLDGLVTKLKAYFRKSEWLFLQNRPVFLGKFDTFSDSKKENSYKFKGLLIAECK